MVGPVEESGVVNGHRFVVDLPEEPLAAEADADKLRQVLDILVDNAVKYSPDGATVTVGGAPRGDGGRGAGRRRGRRVSRRPSASGSSGSSTGRSAARDGAAGTGLGLFIAQGLVTAMGGRIWVDSTEGEGSSFVVRAAALRGSRRQWVWV